MSQGNVRDITEILASIEALNAQADDVSRENRIPLKAGPDLPRSMVAEMAEHQADIVLLEDIHRKGGAEGERVMSVPADEPRPAPETRKDPLPDAEFDQMLSALMKDMGRENRRSDSAEPYEKPDVSVAEIRLNPSVVRDSDSLTELKADIDDLLSPYLDVPAARPQMEPQAETRASAQKNSTSQPSGKSQRAKPQTEPEAKSATARRTAGHEPTASGTLFSDIMTEQMRAQIAEFVLIEIKQQISVWIAQNLDKIVEDALRSLPTESRDASRTRSAG